MENGLKITQVRVWTCFRKCSYMACLYQTALFKRNEETPRKINEEEKQRTINSHNFFKKKMEVKIRAMEIIFLKRLHNPHIHAQKFCRLQTKTGAHKSFKYKEGWVNWLHN